MYSPMFKSTLGKQIIPKLKVLQNNDYTVMAEIVGVTEVVKAPSARGSKTTPKHN